MKVNLLSTLAVIGSLLFSTLSTAQNQAARCDTMFLRDGSVRLIQKVKPGAETIRFENCPDGGQTMEVKKSSVINIRLANGGRLDFPETPGVAAEKPVPVGSSQKKLMPRDSLPSVSIETTDENIYLGTIVRQNADTVWLKTATLGVLPLKRSLIKSITTLEKADFVDGEFWFRNPHSTRYFFQANGYGLRKGEGYYQNTWVFFNQASFGVTDNFTIGVGLVPLFLFGAGVNPVWITPKLSIPVEKDKVNLGVGGFLGAVVGEEGTGFGIVYSNLTIGPRNKNINFGLGYAYAGGEWANRPTFSISGMVRMGEKLALVSENYFISTGDENTTIVSGGVRFLGKKIAIDAALFTSPDLVREAERFVALPWLGITVPFGKGEQAKPGGKSR